MSHPFIQASPDISVRAGTVMSWMRSWARAPMVARVVTFARGVTGLCITLNDIVGQAAS